jgi:hypothetical protein
MLMRVTDKTKVRRNWQLGRRRRFVIGHEPTIGGEGRKAVCVNKARRPDVMGNRTDDCRSDRAARLSFARPAFTTSVPAAVTKDVTNGNGKK